MTTEEIIGRFLDAGRHAFITKTAKKSPEIRKLLRHESVAIEGTEYNYLQELVVVKTAEFIRGILPDCDIEVVLNGNDSTLNLILTADEKRKLTTEMYAFVDKYC